MIKLWRCEICGDPYIGNNPPDNCPFCGAHVNYIKEAKVTEVNFDVILDDRDKENVEHALKVEISNSAFYLCASKRTNDNEGKLLFKALGKVESEHAAIWKKILKLVAVPISDENCYEENKENLEESHKREERAIEFYNKAYQNSRNPRVKEIFMALIEVETDHLLLSEERLKK